MEEKDLRKIARLVERPDIVAMTLAEVMVTLVFLVFIIGMASGAFASGQEPTRDELVKDNARLEALEDALVRGLGRWTWCRPTWTACSPVWSTFPACSRTWCA